MYVCQHHSLIIMPQDTCSEALLCICMCLYSQIIKTWSLMTLLSWKKSHTHTNHYQSTHSSVVLLLLCSIYELAKWMNKREYLLKLAVKAVISYWFPHTLFSHWILLTFLRAGDAFKCLKQPNKKTLCTLNRAEFGEYASHPSYPQQLLLMCVRGLTLDNYIYLLLT